MKKTTVILGIMLLIISLSCTKTETADIAITNVTVIDVTGAPPKSGVTVLITDNRISKIGKTKKTKLAGGVQIIEGSDKFLIPGFWEMYAHLGYSKDSWDLFIANGVTSLRVNLGFPDFHEWRKEISAGKLIGPRMIIASRLADGPTPGRQYSPAHIHNEAEGRQFVRKAEEEGADFIKIGTYLSRVAYFAIIDEAKKQGIPFSGHVPLSVSAAEVSDAGQKSIDHSYGVKIACSSKEEEFRKRLMELVPELHARVKLYEEIDYSEQEAGELFARLIKNSTFVCPTLAVWSELAFRGREEVANDPRLEFVPSWKVDRWSQIAIELEKEELMASLKSNRQKSLDIVGAMSRAGVELLAGTDTGTPYCIAGFSLHDELALFVRAGLSPLEALRTATYNPAKFFGKLDSMGTIEQGKVADLVLLDANPLEDIRNTQKIAAVVIDGKILKKEELQDILSQVEASAKKGNEE
ncbi:MAG TPA: amidohydrolase family protein [Candidatus Heimdallarchaeota archaeon]|nr:amidohydrolase family protein [Candidatus Heimdallarchaeota archaeon]